MVLPKFWGYSLCHHGWPGHSRHLFLDSRILPLRISIADSGSLAIKVLLPHLGQKSVRCVLRALSCVLCSAPLLYVDIHSLAIILSSHFILSLFWNCFTCSTLIVLEKWVMLQLWQQFVHSDLGSGRSSNFTMGLPCEYFLRVFPHTTITFVTYSHMFTFTTHTLLIVF